MPENYDHYISKNIKAFYKRRLAAPIIYLIVLILMAALMAGLQEILKLSDEQLTAFTADFEARLPEYLRNALHPEIAMA